MSVSPWKYGLRVVCQGIRRLTDRRCFVPIACRGCALRARLMCVAVVVMFFIVFVLDVAKVFIIFVGNGGRYLHGPMWGVTGGSIIACTCHADSL